MFEESLICSEQCLLVPQSLCLYHWPPKWIVFEEKFFLLFWYLYHQKHTHTLSNTTGRVVVIEDKINSFFTEHLHVISTASLPLDFVLHRPILNFHRWPGYIK